MKFPEFPGLSSVSTARRRAAAVPPPGFTPRAVAFLRALERNNRREWFHARKDRYEAELRAPMVAFVERLASDLADFAPDHLANPRTSMFRPYRDTRFSHDKAPIKTNVAAVFPHRLLGKHEGAAFYIEVAPRHVWFGGGMYMPATPQLHLVREHIAAHHRQFSRIVGSAAFRRTFGALEGSLLGMIIGSLIIGSLGTGLKLMNVFTFFQSIMKGIVLVLAVLLDQNLKARLRAMGTRRKTGAA